MDPTEADVVRMRRERDLYRTLMHLGDQGDVEPFLAGALGAIVDMTGAAQGLLEVSDEDDSSAERRWLAHHGLLDQEIESVRASAARGIVAPTRPLAPALITGSRPHAPQLAGRGRVRVERIEQILCAPVGDAPRLGVLYLQGRTVPEPFASADRELVETFASHLGPVLQRLLARRRERGSEDATRQVRGRIACEPFVGRSSAVARLLEQVASVAPLDATVLLTGASGTGKSLVARLMHENSPRRAARFVEVNCAALPESLVESELFGALPGAHSTATRRIEGKVSASEHGTLFLDDVSELPPPAQAKLLQLLQTRTYYPLGAARPSMVDLRVIAASNVDLERAIAAQRFRADLYYRLRVVPIRVPSLHERREDIEELATRFCARAAARHRLPEVALSAQTMRTLRAMEWPGNVRQLEHAIEAAVIRAAAQDSAEVEPAHLSTRPEASAAGASGGSVTFQEATRRFQAEFVQRVLDECDWHVSDAARRLDVARSHLYNLIRAFGLARSQP